MDGWKKAWTDWKGVIKSKMAHNRRESVATGGGPYDQKYLQPAEEAIAVLCGLYKLVNGVKGTHTFGDSPTVQSLSLNHLMKTKEERKTKRTQR
ncbi:hypothetical protein ACLKA6_009739 [Drosophila palustris]